jgi:hypothetical protein
MTHNDEIAAKLSAAMPEATNVYDAAHGKYADKVAAMHDTAAKLGTASMPQAADPSPFVLKGAGGGER